MQIVSINISNLLSFPYQETQNPEQKVYFNLHKNGGVNVLIGPNGSGKTNFLKTITQILKIGLMQDYIYNPQAQNQKETISTNQVNLRGMSPHFLSPDKPSLVDIELCITTNDIENMLFIQKKRTLFNTIITNNSTINYTIPECKPEEIQQINTISLQFSIDTKNQITTLVSTQRNDIEQFIIDYLTYQELFQICIFIYNEKIRAEKERAFYPLKNTFGYLSGNRNFESIRSNNHSPKLREQFVADKNSTDYNAILGYALCIKKIRNIINHYSEENFDREKTNGELNSEKIGEKLKDSHFFKLLQESIKKYLNLDLHINYEDKMISFSFIDTNGLEHTIHDLSNGEQSLLIIILNIYGHDIKNGLLIIDEPEIHFHPQMQRRLIRMLEKLNENMGTQCIISTYSPIFINEKNIANVYRCSKINGSTQIKAPQGNMGEDESTIIQILKFENAAKIFFVDRIIMVEGETDAYFFEFYLQYLHTLPERKDKLVNYEIININGKGSYKKRSKFLSKFNIKSSFIGDWDNIVDYGFLTQSDLNYYYKQAKSHYNVHKKSKSPADRHYTKLVTTVKELYPSKYNYILLNIESLYKHNVYIFKRGDIETYLGMMSKGLEETIEFCHNYFHLWLKNKDLEEHRKEMNNIIEQIFTKH